MLLPAMSESSQLSTSLSIFDHFILVIPLGVKLYPTIILIFIYLVNQDIEHTMATLIPHFVKCTFKYFAHFSIEFFCSFVSNL